MILKDQGHAFRGESSKKAWDAAWEFFDRHLKRKADLQGQ